MGVRAGTINDTEAALRAYLGWWQLAGVDQAYFDELPARAQAEFSEAAAVAAQRPSAQPLPAARVADAAWPDTLEAFQSALVQRGVLPGTSLSRIAVGPKGSVDAPIMLIGDCPAVEDCKAGHLFSGAEGALVSGILRALGMADDTAYRATLASSRPASGVLDAADLADYGKLMRHHIGLARPQRIILFGASAARALLGCDLREARGRLHFLNHDRASMIAVATHHPRTMLGHPGCKREAWADLKLLLGDLPS